MLAVGGDGTVRAVAGELLGSGLALGAVPAGTGNLLARNLGIPLNDAPAAVRIARHGARGRLEVGWLEVDRDGDGRDGQEHLFLVMAGAGFDAAMIAGAGSAGSVQAAGADGWAEGWTGSARGVVVGNCGQLTMGLALLPDADPADGFLTASAPLTVCRSAAVGPGCTTRWSS